MKTSMSALALAIALAMLIALTPDVMAGQAGAESITITIDPKEMPSSIFHPGDFRATPVTVTVYDFVIRDYTGNPIEGLIVKTSNGQTLIPISNVKAFSINGWVRKNSGEIQYIRYVADGKITLTDDTQMDVVMNADFGTIEGRTDAGDFFLENPHKVRQLVFNRTAIAKAAEAPVAPQAEFKPEPQVETQPAVEPEPAAESEPGAVASQTKPDSDGDGVPDDVDKCPDTPKGATVNEVGCWALKGINFDYDKSNIKPEYHGVLDENTKVLDKNPTMKVEIQGHTDAIASQEYNQALSEKRAESTKGYLVSKGVNADRIATRGFGKLKPIATNDTPEGRAQNRRVEIEITSK